MFQLSESKDGFRNNNELICNSSPIVNTVPAINNIAAVKIQNTSIQNSSQMILKFNH